MMTRHAVLLGTMLLAAAAATPAFAQGMAPGMGNDAAMVQPVVMVGGQEMLPGRNIVQNALNSSDHTTLVAAVKAAGLVGPLEGHGPLTVFAPTNEAFADLPAGTVETMLKPENETALTKLLEYHAVSGNWTTMALRQAILAGGGKAELRTLAGGTLTTMMNGPSNIQIRDEKGGIADITVADVHQSNGVIQVIDKVLLPG